MRLVTLRLDPASMLGGMLLFGLGATAGGLVAGGTQ
jgi:hypothetical protein